MLKVNHVTKKYKKEKACDDVTVFLPEGGSHVLLGPNGAGKSTIIKCIIGFLKYIASTNGTQKPSCSLRHRNTSASL